MSGTKAGSLKALATIKERHGENFFKSIGHKGGTSIKKVNPETGKAIPAKELRQKLKSEYNF